MAKKNNCKKNRKKNVAVPQASPVKPIRDSQPPAATSPKRIIANQRLYNEMEIEAFLIAATAFEKYDLDARVAEEIKKEFDRRYGPTWHCIIGPNYGASVSFDSDFHFYFYFKVKEILLFKCG